MARKNNSRNVTRLRTKRVQTEDIGSSVMVTRPPESETPFLVNDEKFVLPALLTHSSVFTAVIGDIDVGTLFTERHRTTIQFQELSNTQVQDKSLWDTLARWDGFRDSEYEHS
ncbi:hypothetical protein BC939DRAFT_504359 [Gamsiella multidivaricata]|uniref:uncharacterized protein n=1 Tax=Gamsiella multidivaricata TaxID=101098 RepID=UPI0022209D1C|nr:uncharacterized protein BC939DRAFT_504359 [Gamsiella multidivaricata]KAI7821574.1 hypothetical protein BC939DRAFT_504359 [Gamsiella multidivaricata]